MATQPKPQTPKRPLPVRAPQRAHDRELGVANAQGIRPPRVEENGTGK